MKRLASLVLAVLFATMPCTAAEEPAPTVADETVRATILPPATPAETPAPAPKEDPLLALAKTHTIRSLGLAIVEADKADVFEHRDGRAIKTLPIGTCVLVTKWLDADGLLMRRGARSLPITGAVKPLVPDGHFEGWEPVVMLDGSRGWMRGPTLAALPISRSDVRPVARPLPVAAVPDVEAAAEGVLVEAPTVPADLVEVLPPNAEPGELPKLWARIEGMPTGDAAVSGWVRLRHLEINPAAAQLYAAECWTRARRPAGWYGLINDADRARALLSKIAGLSARTTFLHPGEEGGPPRECHARYAALFELGDLTAGAGDTEQALRIYTALGMEDDRYIAYQGTVPACATYERAMLLFRLKRYDEALAAFRSMVLDHAGAYTPPPGAKRRDVQAVGVIRVLCLRFLKDPARWDKELAALDAAVKDADVRKVIEELKPKAE